MNIALYDALPHRINITVSLNSFGSGTKIFIRSFHTLIGPLISCLGTRMTNGSNYLQSIGLLPPPVKWIFDLQQRCTDIKTVDEVFTESADGSAGMNHGRQGKQIQIQSK